MRSRSRSRRRSGISDGDLCNRTCKLDCHRHCRPLPPRHRSHCSRQLNHGRSQSLYIFCLCRSSSSLRARMDCASPPHTKWQWARSGNVRVHAAKHFHVSRMKSHQGALKAAFHSWAVVFRKIYTSTKARQRPGNCSCRYLSVRKNINPQTATAGLQRHRLPGILLSALRHSL